MMTTKVAKQKVGIIGSGIAGIVSAFLLDKKYDVTLFESANRLGGHTHSVSVMDSYLGNIKIDTGFIVFNLKNYPLFTQFLNRLNVRYQDSDMSFGFWNKGQDFCYSSDFPKGVFSTYKHIFSIRFWHFLYEIKLFNKRVLLDLEKDALDQLSVEDYLNTLPLSSFFKECYCLPMGAAIWSCPIKDILTFPAKSFFMFWKNHCLLTLGKRPIWKTVSGGSQHYIDQFLSYFKGTIFKDSPVVGVYPENERVAIEISNKKMLFDYTVIATHADQALNILKTPSTLQKKLLSTWSYSKNDVCLHTDCSVMPPAKNAWASWVVSHNDRLASQVSMTYYMNRLQKLKSKNHYFVTLNSKEKISKEKIIKNIHYTHPIYTSSSIYSQQELPQLNQSPLFFCGSYFGYGFHEDAVRSAVEVCRKLGVQW